MVTLGVVKSVLNPEVILSTERENSTRLRWMADMSIKGILTRLPSQLIGGFIKSASENFFNCAKRKVER